MIKLIVLGIFLMIAGVWMAAYSLYIFEASWQQFPAYLTSMIIIGIGLILLLFEGKND